MNDSKAHATGFPMDVAERNPELQNTIETIGINRWEQKYHEDVETKNSRPKSAEIAEREITSINEIFPTEDFLSAAASGDVKKIIAMLEGGKSIMTADSEGATAMHFAARNGQMEAVQLLLKEGGEINATDSDGKTPLYWAVNDGAADTVRNLLNLGADIESKTAMGWTPLHAAIRAGKQDVVKILLERNCEVNVRSDFGITPFYLGELNRDYDCLRLLFNAGADPLLKTIEDLSPMDNSINDDDPSRVLDLLRVILYLSRFGADGLASRYK